MSTEKVFHHTGKGARLLRIVAQIPFHSPKNIADQRENLLVRGALPKKHHDLFPYG